MSPFLLLLHFAGLSWTQLDENGALLVAGDESEHHWDRGSNWLFHAEFHVKVLQECPHIPILLFYSAHDSIISIFKSEVCDITRSCSSFFFFKCLFLSVSLRLGMSQPGEPWGVPHQSLCRSARTWATQHGMARAECQVTARIEADRSDKCDISMYISCFLNSFSRCFFSGFGCNSFSFLLSFVFSFDISWYIW